MTPALNRLFEKKTCPNWRHLAALQLSGFSPVKATVWVDGSGLVCVQHTLASADLDTFSIHTVDVDSGGNPITNPFAHIIPEAERSCDMEA